MLPLRLAALSLTLLLVPLAGAAGAAGPVLVSSPGPLGTLPDQGVAGAGYVEQVKGATDGVSVSDDGRYTVFTSQSDGLSSADDDRYANVFRQDRTTGAVVLISQSTGGTGANAYAYGPTISDDGNRVAFTSAATNLAPGDTDAGQDVFVRDVALGTTTVVSAGAGDCDADNGDEDCGVGAISGNGQFVAYTSQAPVVPADANAKLDVYRAKADGTAPALVTQVEGAAAAGNGDSWDPSIDDTGVHVAYTTSATNLAAPAVTDANTGSDVYVRTMGTTDNHLVSGTSGGQQTTLDGGSRLGRISGDGTTVAFATNGKGADPTVADVDGNENVYARTLATNVNRLIDRATGLAGARSDAFSSRPLAISDDGEWILFRSDATTLGIGTNNGTRVTAVYVRRSNAVLGTTNALSVGPNGPTTSAYTGTISGNGARAVISSVTPLDATITRDEIALYARSTNTGAETAQVVSRAPGAGTGAATDVGASSSGYGGIARRMSADGRYVVFVSSSDALSDADVDGRDVFNVYRRDLRTGAIDLVSRATGAGGAGADRGGDSPSISADGSRVAFSSYAGNLGGTAGVSLVYVRDLAAQTTTIASRADGVAGALDPSADHAEISGDGRRVAYVVSSGGSSHAMLRDLEAGSTVQVDRADGAGGAVGNGSADAVSIDDTGTRVAFLSSAKNLDPADTDNGRDAYVRDLSGPTTRLVSRADGAAGAKAKNGVNGLAMSGDGDHVAFKTADSALAPEAGAWPAGDRELVVRDLAAATTRLVSRAGAPSGADVGDFTVDRTGDRIAFVTSATNLVDGAGGTETLFVRRMSTGEVVALAPWTLADPKGDIAVTVPGISADGRCLSFQARGTGPVSGVSPDYVNAYVQPLDAGTCPAADPVVQPPGEPPVVPHPPKGPTVAPKVTKLKLTPARFRVGRKATAVSARATAAAAKKKKKAKRTPEGTTIGFTLSAQAAVTLSVERRTTGRVKGKACVKATKKLAKKRRCTLYVKAGTLQRASVKAGAVKVAFTGRIGKKALAPGAYRVTVVATAAARSSTPVRASFAVVRK